MEHPIVISSSRIIYDKNEPGLKPGNLFFLASSGVESPISYLYHRRTKVKDIPCIACEMKIPLKKK